RGRQPGTAAFRVAQAAQVLDEPQPHGLGDVGGFGAEEAVAPDDRPHQAAEAVDDLVPGSLIATGCRRYQAAGRGVIRHLAMLEDGPGISRDPQVSRFAAAHGPPLASPA